MDQIIEVEKNAHLRTPYEIARDYILYKTDEWKQQAIINSKFTLSFYPEGIPQPPDESIKIQKIHQDDKLKIVIDTKTFIEAVCNGVINQNPTENDPSWTLFYLKARANDYAHKAEEKIEEKILENGNPQLRTIDFRSAIDFAFSQEDSQERDTILQKSREELLPLGEKFLNYYEAIIKMKKYAEAIENASNETPI